MKLYRFFSTILITLLVGQLSAQECKRIISLAPSITNNLYLLGAKDLIVGRTQYCTMAEKDNIPIVADAVNVNIEKVANLKPDIVIASGLTHPRIISAIQKMGIRTLHWYQPKDFNDICKQLEDLARLCGKEKVAQQYIQESHERLTRMAKIAKGKDIFMFLGSNPLYTVLPDSFMNDYIVLLGGKNIFDDLTNGVVSRETVLLRNPDVIIAVSDNQQELEAWKKYTTMKAVKNSQLYFLDPSTASIATPVSFMDILEKLAAQLAK